MILSILLIVILIALALATPVPVMSITGTVNVNVVAIIVNGFVDMVKIIAGTLVIICVATLLAITKPGKSALEILGKLIGKL